MAILYYPKNQILARRDATNPAYEQLDLGMLPNTVIYFDTSSGVSVSSSVLYITASWAQTASVSYLFSSNSFQSVSSSYAETASVALNAVAGGGGGAGINSSSFTTISTGSSRWITASFWEPEQYVSITTAALYNFTCSNPSPAGTMSYTTLFIDNTALATSSLSFPSDWKFIGSLPSSLSSSRVAVLSLRSYSGTRILATFGVQY